MTDKGGRFLDAPMTRTPGSRRRPAELWSAATPRSPNAGAAGLLRREHQPRRPGRRRPSHEAAAQLRVAGRDRAAVRGRRLRCAPTSTRPCSRTCWARAAAAAWHWNASSPSAEQDPSSLKFFMSNAEKDLSLLQHHGAGNRRGARYRPGRAGHLCAGRQAGRRRAPCPSWCRCCRKARRADRRRERSAARRGRRQRRAALRQPQRDSRRQQQQHAAAPKAIQCVP